MRRALKGPRRIYIDCFLLLRSLSCYCADSVLSETQVLCSVVNMVVAERGHEVVRVVVSLGEQMSVKHGMLPIRRPSNALSSQLTSWYLSSNPDKPASLTAFSKFSGSNWPCL